MGMALSEDSTMRGNRRGVRQGAARSSELSKLLRSPASRPFHVSFLQHSSSRHGGQGSF